MSGPEMAQFAEQTMGIRLPPKTVWKLKTALASAIKGRQQDDSGNEDENGNVSRSDGPVPWNDTLNWVPSYLLRLNKVDPSGLHEVSSPSRVNQEPDN